MSADYRVTSKLDPWNQKTERIDESLSAAYTALVDGREQLRDLAGRLADFDQLLVLAAKMLRRHGCIRYVQSYGNYDGKIVPEGCCEECTGLARILDRRDVLRMKE